MNDYKSAGVDIEAGYRSVELMKEYVEKTMRPEVLSGLGGFSGAFSLKNFMGMKEPTLVSGTDGVGTKLKIAFILDKHDTVGIDCVAMCVNDIACAGGEPLFFLDYIACGKNYPEKIAQIVKGVAEGCKQSGAALIGGETAEMPGFYSEDEYDLAEKPGTRKRVVYFLAEFENEPLTPRPGEIRRVLLLSYREALPYFEHESSRRILTAAYTFLTASPEANA